MRIRKVEENRRIRHWENRGEEDEEEEEEEGEGVIVKLLLRVPLAVIRLP